MYKTSQANRTLNPNPLISLSALNRDARPTATSAPTRNVLILGAAGHVAKAVLARLSGRSNPFKKITLLDRNEPHSSLLDAENVQFVRRELTFPTDTAKFQKLIRSNEIDLVLDLTDMDTLPVLEATDTAGVTYINTALNDSRSGIADVLSRIHPFRQERWQAPHILSSGMNPGVVNIWVWDAVRKFGTPEEILHFEYDDSTPKDGWKPIITWSRQEFLTEVVWEPTGIVENGKVKLFPTNALRNREDMRNVLSPIVHLNEYPEGFTVLHEENLKLGRNLGASSRYVYAIHPRTMNYLVELYEKNGTVRIEDLELADNTRVPLTGSDLVGVRLRYPNKDVYYVHRFGNEETLGTNATCAQVACGVEAALHTLATEMLQPRVYFATDLYETSYSRWIFENMEIEQYVFNRSARNARSASLSRNPGMQNCSANRVENGKLSEIQSERPSHVN